MAKLVPKTSKQLLSALEDHLFLLANSLQGLASGDAAYLRELAGKLRALVCSSAGLEGLLWRVCDEIGVDDTVHIRYPGEVDATNPITRKLDFVFAPVAPDGSGDDRVPLQGWSLREHIKAHEALHIGGQSITHAQIIGFLANETGIAHEADGVSKIMARINDILFGDVQLYFSILDADARLALDIGNRVLEAAEQQRLRTSATSCLGASVVLAPRERSLSYGLDVPKAGLAPSHEGSAIFLIDAALAESRVLPARYPPLTMSGVVLSARITRRRRLAIETAGLPLPLFAFDCALPEKTGEPIAVAITWNGLDCRAYVAGKQVAGIVDVEPNVPLESRSDPSTPGQLL